MPVEIAVTESPEITGEIDVTEEAVVTEAVQSTEEAAVTEEAETQITLEVETVPATSGALLVQA